MTILPKEAHTFKTPTAKERATAIASSLMLKSLLDKKQSHYTLLSMLNDTTQETITIPKEALSLLVEILTEMGKGNGVEIVPIKKELTTSEAASILNVSRTYLVELLDTGQIPFHQVGSRRRLLLEDVMNYKNQIDVKREQTLAELAAQAQELNMGY